MARKKRIYDDDDGRTIVDMSGVERMPTFIPRLPQERKKPAQPSEEPQKEPAPEDRFTKEEGRAYVLGALGAALLIGGIFVLAAFLFIVIFLAIYNR